MNNNIRVYDNIIPPDFCDNIVNKFEANPNQWQSESSSSYDFTQIDMGRHRTSWQEETGELLNLLFTCVSKYKEDINPMWPEKHGFESPRIKRYLPNGTDEFRRHVDVNSYDHAKRFLDTSSCWYATSEYSQVYCWFLSTLYLKGPPPKS